MKILFYLFLFVGSFAFMEFIAWFTHKYVMHGIGWFLHASHHQEREGKFELNDWYAVFFSLPAIACIYLGTHQFGFLLPIGLGITAYGLCYSLFHDGLVHKRFRLPLKFRFAFVRRLIKAHYLHHGINSRKHAVSYGFLYAPPLTQLKKDYEVQRKLARARKVP